MVTSAPDRTTSPTTEDRLTVVPVVFVRSPTWSVTVIFATGVRR